MNDRCLHDLSTRWLLPLVFLAVTAGLRAQCTTAPAFTGLTTTATAACHQLTAADVNQLAPNDRCYRVTTDGSTDIPSALRAALDAGGGIALTTTTCQSPVEICVNDVVTNGESCGDDGRIVRRFTARHVAAEATQESVTATQSITFVRPALEALRTVAEAVVYVVDNGQPVPVNPLPRPQDYPVYTTTSGPINLDPHCSFTVDYEDGPRRNGCGNNFRFLRTFVVTDPCTGDRALFSQTMRVGDQREFTILPPPPVASYPPTYGTTDQCQTVVDTRNVGITIQDICNGGGGVNAYVFLDGHFDRTPLGPYRTGTDNAADALTAPLPIGDHVIRFVGKNSYGEESSLDLDIRVVDAEAPHARCRSNFSVFLYGNGEREVDSQLFDGGTTDACGGFRLRAARADVDGLPLETLRENIVFNCADIGLLDVVVEATDDGGQNRARCTLTVEVIDDEAPTCQAPTDVALDCREFLDVFPDDLTAQFTAAPDSVGNLLDVRFGAAAGADNCTESSTGQALSGELSNCGTGRFVRRFLTTDGGGLSQGEVCVQFIDVRPYISYSLLMPADRRYTCNELPEPDDLIAGDTGCDLLSVATEVDTLPVVDGACYRLRLTHEVINWCEYDGASEGLWLPRDADGDGRQGEQLGLHIIARDGTTLTDDIAILDQDYQMGNGNELAELVPNYAASGQRGRFRYEQYVSLADDTPPVTELPAQEEGLAFTDNCLGGVILRFTATDDCVRPSTQVSVDVNGSDSNRDGEITAADFTKDRDIPASQFRPQENGSTEVFIRNLPVGGHLARITNTDECGNTEVRFTAIRVQDRQAPEMDCRRISSVQLSADPVRGGIATVYANDFILSQPETCTPAEITYSVYTEADAGQEGFFPREGALSLDFDCGDLDEQVLRVYAFVAGTNRRSFCNVLVNVTPGLADLCAGRQGSVTGTISTEAGVLLEDVATFLAPDDNTTEYTTRTRPDGTYLFDGLPEQRAYRVQPYRNDAANNGVETFDISQVYSLINNQNYGDFTPYQLLAADVNRSGDITIIDLLLMRSVVLGVTNTFEDNPSWRFIDADYVFPDPTDPWREDVPEFIAIDALNGQVTANFVAIKVGDINNTARPDFSVLPGNPTENGQHDGIINVEQEDSSPNYLRIKAPSRTDIIAFDINLPLPYGTRILTALSDRLGYVLDKRETLHVVSLRDGTNGDFTPIEFLLPDRADAELNLSLAEVTGYTASGEAVKLQLSDATFVGYSLRAVPNPAFGSTNLSFTSEERQTASIELLDINGRVVQREAVAVVAGRNDLHLSVQERETGLYYVRVRLRAGVQVLPLVVR